MVTYTQLICLINYIRAEAGGNAQYFPTPEHEIRGARREVSKAFGFEHNRSGYPNPSVQHQDTLPPVNLATSDPEGHRQAIADADYDAKYDAIHALLAKNDPSLPLADAEEIMRLWPDLKAIMEPGSLCADQLAKLGGNNGAK